MIGLVGAFFSILNGIYGVYPQVWQRTKSIGIYLLISNIFSIISILFFLNLGFGILSLCFGYFVKHFSFFSFQSYWISKEWINHEIGLPIFDKENIISLLSYVKLHFFQKFQILSPIIHTV